MNESRLFSLVSDPFGSWIVRVWILTIKVTVKRVTNRVLFTLYINYYLIPLFLYSLSGFFEIKGLQVALFLGRVTSFLSVRPTSSGVRPPCGRRRGLDMERISIERFVTVSLAQHLILCTEVSPDMLPSLWLLPTVSTSYPRVPLRDGMSEPQANEWSE